MATSGHIERSTPAFTRTALALFCGGFATFALLYCVQPMMPLLSQLYHLSATQSSLVLSVSTLTLAIGLLFFGPLSDVLGRRPVMISALLAAALLTLACALAPGWHSVLLARALLGVALSGLAGVAMSYLSEEIHPAHLGLAMGLYISGNALGGMSGRLIGGVLLDWMRWQAALAVLGVLALLAALLFWRWLPPSRNFQPAAAGLAQQWRSLCAHLTDAGLPRLFLLALLLMGSFVSLFNYAGYYLLDDFSFSQTQLGLLALVYLSGSYASTWFGTLADRHGRRRMLPLAIGLMGAGLALTQAQALGVLLGGILLFTFGFFAAHSLASSWVGRRALQARGQAAALYLFCYYLGSSLAGTAGGLFWQGLRWPGVSLFIAGLLALALLISLQLTRVPPLEH